MNRLSERISQIESTVPRRRGDEPLVNALLSDGEDCSPQARG